MMQTFQLEGYGYSSLGQVHMECLIQTSLEQINNPVIYEFLTKAIQPEIEKRADGRKLKLDSCHVNLGTDGMDMHTHPNRDLTVITYLSINKTGSGELLVGDPVVRKVQPGYGLCVMLGADVPHAVGACDDMPRLALVSDWTYVDEKDVDPADEHYVVNVIVEKDGAAIVRIKAESFTVNGPQATMPILDMDLTENRFKPLRLLSAMIEQLGPKVKVICNEPTALEDYYLYNTDFDVPWEQENLLDLNTLKYVRHLLDLPQINVPAGDTTALAEAIINQFLENKK